MALKSDRSTLQTDISFFMNEVLGGLFYNTVFFGAFYLAKSRIPALARS